MENLPAPHASASGQTPIRLMSNAVARFANTEINPVWGEGLIVSSANADGMRSITWEFNCPAGVYEIWSEYVAAESRPTSVRIDGRMVVRNGLMEFGEHWMNVPLGWHYQDTLSIPGGPHTLALERNDNIPHVRGVALLPVTGATTEPTADQRYAKSLEGRIDASVPMDADDVMAFVRHAAPRVRDLLNDKRDPVAIIGMFNAITRAIRNDIDRPQERLGFGGPMNGQLLRQQIFRRLHRLFQFDVFVETGTFHGTTTEMLALLGRPVFTSELSEELFYRSATRLAGFSNVFLEQADSREFLRKLPAVSPMPIACHSSTWMPIGARICRFRKK